GLPAVGGALREALGQGCRVVGCSSVGEIGPGGYCAQTVTALGFPSASFRVGVCVLRDQALVPVSEWMATLRRFHGDFRPDLRRSSFG
ncbi:FIST N-terminal domain-containing protein, partial [Salmonella enterica subsp. enterica serovar 1,4,[5],12:i:-]